MKKVAAAVLLLASLLASCTDDFSIFEGAPGDLDASVTDSPAQPDVAMGDDRAVQNDVRPPVDREPIPEGASDVMQANDTRPPDTGPLEDVPSATDAPVDRSVNDVVISDAPST